MSFRLAKIKAVFYCIDRMKYFRNSDFKKDIYYRKFYDELNAARATGKCEVLVNTIRKLNNSPAALREKGDIRIQQIFEDNWSNFLKTQPRDNLRSAIVENVEKMIQCKKLELGMSYYECPNCGKYVMCFHTCKSSFCASCGKKRRDKIAANVSKKVIQAPHRQLVFTLPPELRGFFRIYRDKLSFLFEAVNESIVDQLKGHAPKKFKTEKRKIGTIMFLHTYGRQMNWHPHIHVLFCEKFLTKDGELRDYYFLDYDYIRKHFLFSVTNRMAKFLRHSKRVSLNIKVKYLKEIKSALARLKKGSYFYGKKNETATTIKSIKGVARYIARYAAHPAISERRILSYNPETKMVKRFYDPHEDDNKEEGDQDYKGRQFIEEPAIKFMERLIVHINDRYFSVVKYFGFYSNSSKNNYKNIKKMFSDKDIDELILRLNWKFGLLYAFGYNPLLCDCGTEMVYIPEKSIQRTEYIWT